MAQDLGISRTSIWKLFNIWKRRRSCCIDKNKGYKLLSGDLLIAKNWRNCSHSSFFQSKLQITQLDAKAGIEAGNPANTLYLASSQSAGRGRFGRNYLLQIKAGFIYVASSETQSPFSTNSAYTILTADIYKAIKDLTLMEMDIKSGQQHLLQGQENSWHLNRSYYFCRETGLAWLMWLLSGHQFRNLRFERVKNKADSLFTATYHTVKSYCWDLERFNVSQTSWFTFTNNTPCLRSDGHFCQNDKDYKGVAKEDR